MERAIVTTQLELNAIPDDYDGTIIIDRSWEIPIIVNHAYAKPVEVIGYSVVKACGNSNIIARDTCSIWARDYSQIEARDKCKIDARDMSEVEAHNKCCVTAYGNSKILLHGHGVKLRDHRTTNYDT